MSHAVRPAKEDPGPGSDEPRGPPRGEEDPGPGSDGPRDSDRGGNAERERERLRKRTSKAHQQHQRHCEKTGNNSRTPPLF